MFHQSERPSRVLHKAFAIRCPSTELSQDTRALTEQVASQAHQPSKSNINLRSATWTSKSQCPIHDLSSHHLPQAAYTPARNSPHVYLLPLRSRLRHWKRSLRSQELVKRSLATTSEVRNVEGIRCVCTITAVANGYMVFHDYLVHETPCIQERKVSQSLAAVAQFEKGRIQSQERDRRSSKRWTIGAAIPISHVQSWNGWLEDHIQQRLW